jgi:hypothetical protein
VLDVLALLVLAVLFVLLVGALIMRQARLSELRRSSKPNDELDAIGQELLDYVRRESDDVNAAVPLRPFWKGRGLTDGDKNFILAPLIWERVLRTHGAPLEGFEAVARDIYRWVARPLPPVVALSPREYRRMTNGVSSAIIIERLKIVMHDERQSIKNSGSGNIVGATQAGRDARSESRNVSIVSSSVTPTAAARC